MKNTLFKSIGAVLAGLVAGAVLSVGMDFTLSAAGILDMDRFKDNPSWLVLVVALYRFLFNTAGCYIAAALAPARPMRHALALGFLGLLLSLLGSFMMWDQAVAWYNISIILMALPCAWIGGRLYLNNIKR